MRTQLLMCAAVVLLGPIACDAIWDIREFPAPSGASSGGDGGPMTGAATGSSNVAGSTGVGSGSGFGSGSSGPDASTGGSTGATAGSGTGATSGGSAGASTRVSSGAATSGGSGTESGVNTNTASGATAGTASTSGTGNASGVMSGIDSGTGICPSDGSACGQEPTALAPSAAGCVSIRLVYDSGTLYWADMGHGTISSMSVGGGPVTTIATGLHIAAVHTTLGVLMGANGNPLATTLLAHAGTVYWIGAQVSGGPGTTIMSATSPTTSKTLLAMPMDPGPSPVSVANGLEAPGVNPPIAALALSPDGSTLYFAAGTRFYSIPSTGAGAPTYVGYANGPEHGEATALAADNTYLSYPTIVSGDTEILTLGAMCDPDAAVQQLCPSPIAMSQGGLVVDTIVNKGVSLYWGNGSSIRKVNVTAALAGNPSVGDFAVTAAQTSLTGFAIGTQSAYFGEPGSDDAGYVEKSLPPPLDGGASSPALVIARGQPTPMSFALDGARVYWTTRNCDINYVEDSPQ